MQNKDRVGLGELSALIPMLQKQLPEYAHVPYELLWKKLGRISQQEKKRFWHLLAYNKTPMTMHEARIMLLVLITPKPKKTN